MEHTFQRCGAKNLSHWVLVKIPRKTAGIMRPTANQQLAKARAEQSRKAEEWAREWRDEPE